MYDAALLYRLRANISFAAGYTITRANLLSSKPHQSGLFDFNTKGPEFLVRVAF
jgi:hypothetical protein